MQHHWLPSKPVPRIWLWNAEIALTNQFREALLSPAPLWHASQEAWWQQLLQGWQHQEIRILLICCPTMRKEARVHAGNKSKALTAARSLCREDEEFFPASLLMLHLCWAKWHYKDVWDKIAAAVVLSHSSCGFGKAGSVHNEDCHEFHVSEPSCLSRPEIWRSVFYWWRLPLPSSESFPAVLWPLSPSLTLLTTALLFYVPLPD